MVLACACTYIDDVTTVFSEIVLGQVQSLDKFDAQVCGAIVRFHAFSEKTLYVVAVDVRTGQEGLTHTPGSFCAYPRGGS